jgi:hypothetical protein
MLATSVASRILVVAVATERGLSINGSVGAASGGRLRGAQPPAAPRAAGMRATRAAVIILALALLVHAPPARAQPAAFDDIYNGTPTADFPAVVGLGITNRGGSRGICTGTLIAPSAVLTAAHCLASDPVEALVVVYPNGSRVDYAAAAFVLHPRFSLARAAVADIGIVHLSSPVADVAPLPLAQRAPRPGTTGTIVGFGDDGDGGAGLKRSGTVRLRRCPRVVRARNGKVRLAKSLCWRPTLNDTCSGDSGGPLIVNGAVAGVTSGGIGFSSCPGVLSFDTNVARYRGWIAGVLGR